MSFHPVFKPWASRPAFRVARAGLAAAVLLAAPLLPAAVFPVTNLDDFDDLSDPPVAGSLRQAILTANASPTEVHEILFDPGLEGTLTLVRSLPDVLFSGSITRPGHRHVSITSTQSLNYLLKCDYGNDPLAAGSFTLSGLDFRDATVVNSGVIRFKNGTLVLEDTNFHNIRGGPGTSVLDLERTATLSRLVNNCFSENTTATVLTLRGDSALTAVNGSFTGNRVDGSVIQTGSNCQVDLAHNTFHQNTTTSTIYAAAVDVAQVGGEFASGTVLNLYHNLLDGNFDGAGKDRPLRTTGTSPALLDPDYPNQFGGAKIQRLAHWHLASYLIPRPESAAVQGTLEPLFVPTPLNPDINTLAGKDARGYNRPPTGVHFGAVQVFSEPVVVQSPASAAADLAQAILALQTTSDPLDFIALPAGTYELNSALPVMHVPVVFLGPETAPGGFPAATIDGANEYRLLNCTGDPQMFGKEFGCDGLHLLRGGNAVNFEAGGLSAFDGARVFIANSVFNRCNSGGGLAGGIAIRGGSARILRCVVHDCEQQTGGYGPGGIAIYPSFPEGPARVEISDSILTDNTGAEVGAAIYGSMAQLTLTHCTIHRNTTLNGGTNPAGAGVFLLSSESQLTLRNTVITGNLRDTNPDDLANDGTTANTASIIGDPGATFGNFPHGPLSLPAHPAGTSSVLNAADPSFATAADFLGSPRNAFGLPDVGAVEYYRNQIERDHASDFADAPCLPAERQQVLGLDRDPDQDGSPTWLELITGTPPLAPNRSVLTHAYAPGNQQFTLVIPEYSEEIADIYRVSPDLQDSPDLALWNWTNGALGLSTPIPGKPGWFSYTYTVSGLDPAVLPRRFFRLALSAAPALPYPCVVGIGEPNGNAGDPDNGFGQVDSPFAVSKYEVTNTEYAAFLNSVDPEAGNARSLFDPRMASDPAGGIELTGGDYVVKPQKENHPVNFVAYDSARRYCNWLHNGANRDSDTETGAYDMNSDGPRLAAANWFLPTFDEWYKAAYFVTSTGPAPAYAPIYSDYPTGASINNNPAPGNSRSANYGGQELLPVGSFPSAASLWGAFDLAGNIAEMLETPNSPTVTLKGAAFSDGDETNAFRNVVDAQNKTTPTAHGGFRVATRP